MAECIQGSTISTFQEMTTIPTCIYMYMGLKDMLFKLHVYSSLCLCMANVTTKVYKVQTLPLYGNKWLVVCNTTTLCKVLAFVWEVPGVWYNNCICKVETCMYMYMYMYMYIHVWKVAGMCNATTLCKVLSVAFVRSIASPI